MDRYFKSNDNVNGYTIIKIIGQGRYGIAYLATNDKNQKCVVKQLKKEMLEKNRRKIIYEQQLLERLDNQNFPKFISKFNDEDREGYILEFIEGKVFHNVLVKERYEFSKDEIYKVCEQLLDLIEILHKNNIVHRDIRPPNVIIKDNNDLALIDFGLARNLDGKRYRKEEDYWYLADFLIHLYYSNFKDTNSEEKPWFEELALNDDEIVFLKRLMGLDGSFNDVIEIREQLEKLKNR